MGVALSVTMTPIGTLGSRGPAMGERYR